MAETLPKVLLLKPPPIFLQYESQFSHHFQFLKHYTSSVSLPDFLAAVNAVDVSVIFGTNIGPPITASTVLNHVPNLRCIVTSSIGVDFIDLDECRRRNITVANASNVFSVDCANHAVALLIDVLRDVSCGDRFVRSGSWKNVSVDFPLGRRLGSQKIGIVGLGSIGSRVAKRLAAFNCSVSYTSRKQKTSVPYTFYPDIYELAENSNVLVVCCPLTDETRHMINKKVLLALGKEGVVINISRGSVVDEKELVRFLLEGQIAGAGLDVFENEPSVPNEILTLDNVVLSPHCAAFTEEAFHNLYEFVKGNLQAFFLNKPLHSSIIC